MNQRLVAPPPQATRFRSYLSWATAQNLGPWQLCEVDGPWPVTVTYMRAPPGRMKRASEDFHDLFISARALELWESSKGRRRRYIFRRGTVAFTAAGHDWDVTWTGLLEGFGFLLTDATLRSALGRDGSAARWRLAFSDHAPAIGFLGIEIATQVFAGFPEGRAHVDELLGTFLAMAARRYGVAPERDALKLGRQHPQVQRAVRFIDDRLGDPISLDHVCRAADMSVAHLNRCFHTELGTSVWQYVKARRLEKARGLLRDGRQPLQEIASACGFSSTSHLITSFRGRYGITPGRARLASGGINGEDQPSDS